MNSVSILKNSSQHLSIRVVMLDILLAILSAQIESLVSAAAEKEAVLTAKLKDHMSLLQERDSVDQQLKEILKELDLAQRTITEQVNL